MIPVAVPTDSEVAASPPTATGTRSPMSSPVVINAPQHIGGNVDAVTDLWQPGNERGEDRSVYEELRCD
jgi:hypothetical protein